MKRLTHIIHVPTTLILPQKPIMQYLQENHFLEDEDYLPSHIPSSIFIQHYVFFRIALKRYAARLARILWMCLTSLVFTCRLIFTGLY